MLPGLRQHKQASLRIATPDIPEDMRERTREIVALTSEQPGNGHAKALMYQVTAEADLANVVLMLTVKPFAGGMTQAQLEKFYTGFGFEVIQSEPVLMARTPQKRRVVH